jgi:hypothetical protein
MSYFAIFAKIMRLACMKNAWKILKNTHFVRLEILTAVKMTVLLAYISEL